MVLIISDRVEQTEIEVFDWLISKKVNCKLISSSQFLKEFIIYLDNNLNLSVSKVKKIWMRRDRFSASRFLMNTGQNEIISYLEEEADTLKDFILEKKNSSISILSSYSNKKLNKLTVLKKAKEFGLNIPEFIITNRKNHLEKFIQKHDRIITKSVFENLRFDENQKRYFQYVEIIDDIMLSKIPNEFFPTFFQKYIPQKYEIRAFYFNGEIYSMANIITQGLTGDIRRTGYVSRKIPFRFEQNHINKITKLMKNLNLTIGALDFIIDSKNDLYFLEVNPNGNFLVVSKECNYHLEEKVADYLAYG